MILDYVAKTESFVLKIPRAQKDLVQSVVQEHGLDFSQPASTPETAVLFTKNPYAAAAFNSVCSSGAKAQLAAITSEIEASWSKGENLNGYQYSSQTGDELWPFQRAALAYCLARQHSLVGDQPGLGKTPTAICLANELRAKRVLVLCPANIRLQWARQIRNWSNLDGRYTVYPILKSGDGVHPTAAWTIVSYDLARAPAIHRALLEGRYDLLILDEAHYLKTIDARRTRAVFDGAGVPGLCDRAERMVALTGTPLPNRPRECLGANTLVLTNWGWRPIVKVRKTDLLWDGIQWVKHQGLLYQGCAQTVSVAGIIATATHRFLGKSSWVPAVEACQNTDIQSQLLAIGSANLPSLVLNAALKAQLQKYWRYAIAGQKYQPQQSSEYELDEQVGAELAVQKLSYENMMTFVPRASESICLASSKVLSNDAIIRETNITDPMAGEVSKCTQNGWPADVLFWNILFRWKTGISRLSNLTEQIMIKDMNQVIYVGLAEKKIWETDERFINSKNGLKSLRPVYDLANAGPNQRFTVLSAQGPMLVHNCYTMARGLCWDSIDFLSEERFRDRFNPSQLMVGKSGNKFVKERTGRLPELQNRLRANFMVRRLKRDVLDQLPEVRYQITHVEKSGDVRKALEAESMLQIDPENFSGIDLSIIGQISAVRKMMGVAMAPQVADYVEMLLDGGEEKLFLVGWHIEVLNMLEKRLGKYGLVRVDGSTSGARRQAAVDTFRSDPSIKVFLGNIQAIGIGVDGLQSVCSHMVGAEASWTPADNEQVVDRLNRWGQQEGVLAEWMVAPDSFAERILGTAIRKLKDIHHALDAQH